MKISVVIIVKNGGVTIEKTLESIKAFEDVIVFDNGSTDNTIEIVKRFQNVKLVEGNFIGFGPTKNKAVSYAKHDWVLSLDSDEVVTQEILEEVKILKLNSNQVYSIDRLNHYNNKPIKCCGWDNDMVVRLFNKQKTGFNSNLVHEGIVTENLAIVKLKNKLEHFPFRNATGLVDKMQKYATLYAKEHKGKKSVTPFTIVLKTIVAFIKNYIIKKGMFYGYEGLLIATSNTMGVFYKYIKLYEENKGIEQ